MNKGQKGFSAVVGIIIGLVILAVVSTAGYFVFKNQKMGPVQDNAGVSPETDKMTAGAVEAPSVEFSGTYDGVVPLLKKLTLEWKSGVPHAIGFHTLFTACSAKDQPLLDSFQNKLNAGEIREFVINGILPVVVTPRYGGIPAVCRKLTDPIYKYIFAEINDFIIWSEGCDVIVNREQNLSVCQSMLKTITGFEKTAEGAY